MQNKLKILQIGSSDWSKEFAIPDNMAWYYFFPNSNLVIKKVMEMNKINKFRALQSLSGAIEIADGGSAEPRSVS